MYNPTCIVSGKTNDLQMHAIRNEKGNMIGWFFINKEHERDLGNLQIDIRFEIIKGHKANSKMKAAK